MLAETTAFPPLMSPQKEGYKVLSGAAGAKLAERPLVPKTHTYSGGYKAHLAGVTCHSHPMSSHFQVSFLSPGGT